MRKSPDPLQRAPHQVNQRARNGSGYARLVLTVLWPGERFNRGVECNLDIAKIALEAFFLLIGSV